MSDIAGHCDPRFERVEPAFERVFREPRPSGGPPDVGAAFAVMLDGELVVDLWGGIARPSSGEAWQRDTIQCVFSCTKGMTALCVLLLHDRGLLDYDAPVASYWPEFAAAGKEHLTVRQLVSHQAGLPRLRAPLPAGGFLDWNTVVTALAAEEPHWPPGTAHGYHTLSFGHLAGELVRRIDGRDVGRFFAEEIAGPWNIDLLIGFEASHDHRVADMIDPPLDTSLGAICAGAHGVDPFAIERFDDPALLTPSVANTRAWRAAQIPGANGHGNARSLARVYGGLARGGTLDGRSIVSREAIDLARTPVVHGIDETIKSVMEYGLGFRTMGGEREVRPGTGCFGHGGAYGQIGLADPEHRIGIGWVHNQCGDPLDTSQALPIIEAVYACL